MATIMYQQLVIERIFYNKFDKMKLNKDLRVCSFLHTKKLDLLNFNKNKFVLFLLIRFFVVDLFCLLLLFMNF